MDEVIKIESLMLKTATKKGLKVQVRINDKVYLTKQVSRQEDINQKRILKHPTVPNLSYTILP